MKAITINPDFAIIDKADATHTSTILKGSKYPGLDIFFNIINTDYPITHIHSHWEIFVVLSGSVKHNINGRTETLNKGDACLIRPSDAHSLTGAKNCMQINFVFSCEYADKVFPLYSTDYFTVDAFYKWSDTPLNFKVSSYFIQSLIEKALPSQSLPPEQYRTATNLMLHTLIAEFFEYSVFGHKYYPDWLNDFLVYLQSPESFSLSMKELSDTTPYSYANLNKLFRRYTKTSLLDYVTQVKLRYAQELLRTTDYTTLTISGLINYSSLSSFNHNFKKFFGVTPREFRKSATTQPMN